MKEILIQLLFFTRMKNHTRIKIVMIIIIIISQYYVQYNNRKKKIKESLKRKYDKIK
jgi:hypothetical protein